LYNVSTFEFTLNNVSLMSELMIMEKNPETGDWLCYIPNSAYAWYVKGEKKAAKFCKSFNTKFESNKLRFNPVTRIIEQVKKSK
jgi:Cys-tRNA synthase (O-phospho-L-seryl-tRNA:Cys-tRNA synthase)